MVSCVERVFLSHSIEVVRFDEHRRSEVSLTVCSKRVIVPCVVSRDSGPSIIRSSCSKIILSDRGGSYYCLTLSQMPPTSHGFMGRTNQLGVYDPFMNVDVVIVLSIAR